MDLDQDTSLYGAAGAQDEPDSFIAKRAQCETFHLTTNFRSHSGIVDCAYSLVKIIEKYWPSSIDYLPQEHGKTAGQKPLIFSSDDSAELHRALFRDT